MANNERSRSPSAGRIQNLAQASSNTHFDPSFAADTGNQYNTLGAHSNAFQSYNLDPSFTNYQEQQTSGLASQGGAINYLTSQGFVTQGNTNLNYSQGVGEANLLGQTSPPALNNDSSAFPSFDFNQADFSEDALDPALLNDFEPKSQQQAGGPLDHTATSMQPGSPTPPHLLPEMARRQSQSPSPHASPVFQQQSAFNRPRNVSESLDPSSAMYPPGQNEWSNMGAYRNHRRTPSDQYSDYSNHSNQASPYNQPYDTFDANAHSSPMLHPQADPTFGDALGFQSFTLSENQAQQTYHTPGHSPHISPALIPQQQALPAFTAENNFGLNSTQFNQQSHGLDMFAANQEPFPQLNKPQSPSDFGAADQMSPPEINVEYAPPAANPNQILRSENNGEALSPPARTQSRNRMRAKSDSYAGSRGTSPAISARGRSPSLQPLGSDTLQPFAASQSRSPSPRGRDKPTNRNRSTSHASDQRDYVLDLADPERSRSNGAKDNGRVQKHPATFQCHLCPKRFTRAYNLRSHLRTHTDERPFVCTVCGKAFARQHDRKRHEGLHSGEKKFVCKGNLQSGAQWGCGRRFARADALGRHFRSEAGRVCIKPLLDEEAEERHKAWMEEQQQAQVAAGLVAPQPLMGAPQMDMNANFLPSVLLQQYPALANIDWNTIPQGPPPEEEYSGRSSFEASSGNEYYDDMSGDEMGAYSDSQMGGMNNMGMQHMGMQQAQAGMQQHQQGFYGGQSTGDYLSDFEGR